MNSLNTDDILGAKPTVRHMPMNLLRERRTPTAFLTNMHPQHRSQSTQKAQQYPSYPSNQRFNPNIYQMPYSNLAPHDYPVPANKRMRKLPKCTNYDFSYVDQTMERYEEKPQLPRIQSQISNLPKVKEIPQLPRQDSSINPEKQKEERKANKSMDMQPEMRMGRSNSQAHSSRKSSFQREDIHNSKLSQERRIFKGLGFNIITNRNYEYLFEYKDPSILQ